MNRQFLARPTIWLDRLSHFDFFVQQTVGSPLKITDYQKRNLMDKTVTREKHGKQFVINISTIF